ncbi:hypothetical protein DL96DRAFT_1817200 [Flagelloscypha sp. PMI_526]|nr:hypothetical protein DL96DRAFT_1817200 [Flagelloscypha sp. PMI_526]
MPLSFSQFLDLPLEIQHEIWHCFAGHYGNREKLVLLRVSWKSYPWAHDRLYHTLSIRMSNADRIATAVKQNPVPFREKTHQLELSMYSLPAWFQAQEILPVFQSLRRVHLELELGFSVPAEILLRIPILEELTFECGLILEDWHNPPSNPGSVLQHFPQLTHLAIRRFGRITEVWLRDWCEACPSTLYVFLVLDMLSSHSQYLPIHIPRPLHPRPVVSNESFYSQYFWATFPSMWVAAEAAIRHAEIEKIDKNYLQIK